MAKGYAQHLCREEDMSYVHDLREQQRMLLFRIVHAINREQELSAPMVISYLMGWEDMKRFHHYIPIYWSSFAQAITKSFPQLCHRRALELLACKNPDEENVIEVCTWFENLVLNNFTFSFQNAPPLAVTLEVNATGQLYMKNQMANYSAWGDALQEHSLFDFFTDTYKGRVTVTSESDSSSSTKRRKCGCSRHARIPFQSHHLCHQTRL